MTTKLEQAEAIITKVEQIHIFTAAKTVEDGKQKALERKDREQGQFLEMTKTMKPAITADYVQHFDPS